MRTLNNILFTLTLSASLLSVVLVLNQLSTTQQLVLAVLK